jgi:hypothetical protein
MRVHIARYEKPTPTKSDRLVYLFCEGDQREPNYFNYFKRKYSKLNLYIVPFPKNGNNSPKGLLQHCLSVINNPSSDYSSNTDSIWLCLDLDDRNDEIGAVKKEIATLSTDINIAASNRSFEVWLYYHFFDASPLDKIENWKSYLDEVIPGGFDVRKHPEFAEIAVLNAEKNYSENEEMLPNENCTSVFRLVKLILSLSE